MSLSHQKSPEFRHFSGFPSGAEQAFNLIECLAAVTVMMVLVALLFPILNSVRQRSKTMVCLNNIRQIGTGIFLYSADHGHLPYSCHLKGWADWGEAILPYMETSTLPNGQPLWLPGETWAVGMVKVNGTGGQHLDKHYGQGLYNKNTGAITWKGYSNFTCPAGPASKSIGGPPWDGSMLHRYPHHYACNEFLMPYGHWSNSPGNYGSEGAAEAAYNAGTYVPFPPVQPQELERPGSLVLICESGADAAGESPDTLPSVSGLIATDFDTDPAGAPTRGGTAVVTPAANDNDSGLGGGWPVYARHAGRCNTLMADGHVEQFANGEMKRRNFVSHGRVKRWGTQYQFVEAEYP